MIVVVSVVSRVAELSEDMSLLDSDGYQMNSHMIYKQFIYAFLLQHNTSGKLSVNVLSLNISLNVCVIVGLSILNEL